MPGSRYFVGIDLGTTFSTLAYVDETGRVDALRLPDDTCTLASAIYFKSLQEAVVGTEALNFAVVAPDRVAQEFKRHMGEPNWTFKVDGHEFRPEELSAMVVRKLLELAVEQLGPIEKAVISVPQVFQESRRRATQDAGKIAGLKDVDLIEEPVAAAIAYGHTLMKGGGFVQALGDVYFDETVLVYDLGGGTFDVTIMKLEAKERGKFEALATAGDEHLGGKDWDEVLEGMLCDHFAKETGHDPRQANNPALLQDLRIRAIDAKKALSDLPRVPVSLAHDDRSFDVMVKRGDFETRTRHLLTRTEHTLTEMLEKNQMSWNHVDRVLLVGGSSRMPMVGRMLERVTKRYLDLSLPPDVAVAKGAALYAASKAAGSHVEVRTVNSHALGVLVNSLETKKLVNRVLLPVNQPTRTRQVRTFRLKPGMKKITLPIMLGDAEDPGMCDTLGHLNIPDLPANLPNRASVEVGFMFQDNGLLQVDVQIQRGPGAEPLGAKFQLAVDGTMSEDQVLKSTADLKGISFLN